MARRRAVLVFGGSRPIDLIAPTITTAATANNPENTVLAISLTADEPAVWTLTGGADIAKFQIVGTTLRWAGNGTKDFEAPDDSDTNNTYVAQVTATDASGNATNKTITVTVTDVSEPGVFPDNVTGASEFLIIFM